jgi:hypothetical protein
MVVTSFMVPGNGSNWSGVASEYLIQAQQAMMIGVALGDVAVCRKSFIKSLSMRRMAVSVSSGEQRAFNNFAHHSQPLADGHELPWSGGAPIGQTLCPQPAHDMAYDANLD